MDTVKKNDWLATLVFNPDKTIDDFKALGITPDNTGLLSLEEYKSNPTVQQLFSNPDTGKLDEGKLADFYYNAKNSYEAYENNNWVESSVSKYGYGEDAWFAPLDAKVRDEAPKFFVDNKSSNVSQGISFITETGNSFESDLSIRELAQREKVVDSETGEVFDWSPNEKGGLFKSLSRPILVLAQWDEDDTHTENGIEVAHKKGDLKLNENGKPYYETLGNRDIYGKDVLHYVDTLTVDGTKLNKFDIFDSDSKEKGIGATLIRTAAQVAPMFAGPVIGTLYGAITAIGALNRVMPILAKGVDSIITGTDDNPFGRKMSEWEAWSEANFNWQTVSDKGRESFFTTESLGNLIGAISGQLFQQKLIGTLPAILNKAGSYKKNAELGKDLALGYMAITSAQDAYSDFKQAGATDQVAGWGMIASMVGLYGLMNQEYFRDNLFKYSFMDETGVRVPALKVAQEFDKKTLESLGKTVEKQQAAGFINNVKNIWQNKFINALNKNEFVARSVAEGTEEVMEEVVTDLIKAFNLGLEGLGANLTESKNQNLDFGWTGQDFLQRYTMNALGGFIGGGLFHLQGKYDTWYRQRFHPELKNDIADDDFKRLVYFVGNGQADTIRGYYTKWWRQGRLGSTNLKADDEVISYLDENKVVQQVAKRGDYTQNDVVYAALMNMVSELEQSVKAETGLSFIRPDDLDKIAVRGFNPDKHQLINAHAMVELGSYSRFANDFWSNIAEIVKAKNALDVKIKDLESEEKASTDAEKKASSERISKNEEIKHLQDKIKELEEKKKAFLNGDLNKYYAGQSIFFINENLNKHFLEVKDINDFSLMKYKTSYENLPDYQKQAVKDDFDDYLQFTGAEKLAKAYDLYLAFSQTWGPTLQEATSLLKDISADTFHTGNLEYENYVALLQESNKLTEDIKRLMSDENTDKQEIENLKVKQSELISKISAIQDQTPDFILQLQVDDKYSTLRDSFLTDVDTPTLITMLNSLRSIYSAAKGKYLANDDQLNSFYSLLVKQYKKISTADRFSDLLSQLPYDLSENDDPIDLTVYNGKSVLFNDPSEDMTDFQRDVISDFDTVVDLLGIDNQAFLNKIEEIASKIKANTTLTDDIVNRLVNSMLPWVGKDSISDIVREFDRYKSDIIYDPFVDTLAKLITKTIGGQEYSIVDLLNMESKRLAESESLTKYIIQNDKLKEMFSEEKINPLAQVFTGILLGAWDNTNALINSFTGGEIADLSEIDDNVFKLLSNQAANFFSKMRILKAISDYNSSAALRISQDIEINMRPKFIQKLIDPAFAVEFDKIFTAHVNIQSPDKPSLISKFEELFPNGINFNAKTDNYYKENNAGFVAIENYVFDVFNAFLQERGRSELIKNIRHLVAGDEKNNLYKGVVTTLSKKQDEEITPYTFGQYLGILAVLPSSTFYNHEKEGLNENGGLTLAPTFGQEWAYRASIAFITNPKFFNALLDEFTIPDKMLLDSGLKDHDVDWLKGRPRLHNFLMVPGGAGTGKTVGYCGTLIQSVASYNKGVEVLALAPEEKQAKKLANSLGITDKSKYFTRVGFQKELIDTVLGNYITEGTRVISADYKENRGKYKYKKLYDDKSDIKILVIDEVTLFTADELNLISDWAEENGVLIFGLGDPKQTSRSVLTKIITKDGKTKYEWSNTGIEDCVYWKCPKLTASLRNANEAKRVNETWMSTYLDEIDDEYTKHPEYSISQLDAKIPDSIPLVYYESPDRSVLYGEKLIKSADMLRDYIDRFKGKGSIMIIADTEEKVADYKARYQDDGITVVNAKDAQGGESDYVFVDKDFKKANEAGTSTSKYLIFKDLYTTSQRSTTATVIVDDGLSSTLKITDNVSNELYNQVFKPIDKGQIESAKQWKLETLSNVSSNQSLFDLFDETSENRKGYERVTGETTDEKPEPEASKEGDKKPEGEAATNGDKEKDGDLSGKDGNDPDSKAPEIKPIVETPEQKPKKLLRFEVKSQNLSKPTDISLPGKSLFNYFKAPNFISYDENGNLNGIEGENSLAEFILNFDNQKRRLVTPKDVLKYKKWINCIASFVKENMPLPEMFAKDLANFIVGNEANRSDLIELFQRKPDVYFVNYNSGIKVIARYTTSETNIDIPIGFIYNNKPSVGKFNGTFEMRRTTDKRYLGDTKIDIDTDLNSISLEEFYDLNPFVIISDTWGILSVKDLNKIEKDEDLRDSAKEFLGVRLLGKDYVRRFNNNGKAFAFATTSPAINYQLSTPNAWFPQNGHVVGSYGKAQLVGLQKIADVETITDYVRSFTRIFKDSKKQEEWLKQRDPRDTIKYLTGQEISSIKESDRRKYQVIPNQILGYFTQGLFDIAKENESLMKHLSEGMFNYLHSGTQASRNARGESHNLLLFGDNQRVLIQPVLENGVYTGKYNVIQNYGTKNETSKEVIINLFGTDFSDFLEAAFDGQVDSAEVFFRTIVNADEDHSAYYQNVVPNKVLFYLLNNLNEDDIRFVNDKLSQNLHFRHGCYVNMHGDDSDDDFSGSYFKPYKGSKNNMYIRVKEIVPADYIMTSVNVDSSDNQSFEVNGHKAYKSLADLINDSEIEDNPKLWEVLNRNDNKMKVLNHWLLATSHSPENIPYIVQDERTKLYYWSSYNLKDPTKWIVQNFNWRELNNFDLNENLNNIIFDGDKEQFISNVNNFKYGLFFVSLPNESQYFIRKNNGVWEYKPTTLGRDFSTLQELANSLNSTAITAYINTLPFDYISDYDDIVKSAYNEIQNRKDAKNLNTTLNAYLEKRLNKKNEC